jgi:ABC-2 type transport system ATP-binding protein
MIQVTKLSKTFTSHKWAGFFKPKIEKTFTAVQELSFEVKKGEFTALLGPNGAGKTTTLKMLTGILYPTSGTVTVAGFTPWKKENEFKKSISFVMAQKSQLFLELPLKDTFDFLAEIYNIDKQKHKKTLTNLLQRFELDDKLETQGRRLSLGQRMKAELICCFMYEPKVIFLDEPTIGLDINSAIEVRSFLKQTNKEMGTTIILTTHNMDDVEELCPRTIVINHGQKIFDDQTIKLRNLSGDNRTLEIIYTHKAPQDSQLPPEITQYDIKRDNNRLYITLERSNTSKAIQLLISENVADINIHEEDLSKVIARLYKHPII